MDDSKIKNIVPLSDYYFGMEQAVKREEPNVTNPKTIKRKVKELFGNKIGSSFFCKKNPQSISFLSFNAIENELKHLSRTYFYEDENENMLGYSSIGLRALSLNDVGEKRKDFVSSGKNPQNIEYIAVYLIGEICKNDKFINDIHGNEIMDHVINEIVNSKQSLGGRFITLDSVNNPKIIKFYESYGFHKYGSPFFDKSGTNELQGMACDLNEFHN